MRNVVIVSALLVGLVIPPLNGVADESGKHGSGTHTKVSGVVSKVQSGVVYPKTS